ncbi:DUF4179 domain-containing protein [Paenibacillus brasilensis]|uniref:DUF4179 domain-containing protein n=1 Tax=Paenibacillus brasilensis TaxID=128574 RepID=A0ABU0KZA8_9BACL|nr:DUF4179 domain-containing protein [Paenibacillus brasilensis]MDQ0494778.1 hypothetical protein [Paenibacillus brasilensis]
MNAWSDPTEHEQMEQVRRTVKNKKMPQVSYADDIMKRLGEMNMVSRKLTHKKGTWTKKIAIGVSAAAVLGGVVLGSGFVSPAMAEALKNIPLLGSVLQYNFDSSLQLASKSGLTTAPNLSVTRDGVTLNIKEVMFDGTRLVFMIERQGVEDEKIMSPYLPEDTVSVEGNTLEKVPVDKQKKGYLFTPNVFIQGQRLVYGMFTSAVGKREDGKLISNMAMYEVTKGLSEKNLPDEFDMTVKVDVSGFQEPFEFQVPVKNLSKSKILLKPDKTQSSGTFSYTVKQIELTPVTTRLIVDSKGQVPSNAEQSGDLSATKMYYDIVDQDGNQLEQHMLGLFHRSPDLEYHEDEAYSPFAKAPTSITIKPYTMTVKKDWSVIEDQEGKMLKTYHKDLEMTIPVPAQP